MQGISDYLKHHHPQYRQPTMRKLYERIRALKDTPYIGRPGREEGTREIHFPPMPYVAVYRVREDAIEIIRVYHTAQDRP
jgi:addiction module RelE/StbE family toxin